MCRHGDKTRIKIGRKLVYVDTCLIDTIIKINQNTNLKTIASCCGHGIYKPTIFVQPKNIHGKSAISEWFSKKRYFPQKKRYLTFYEKDKKGYYHLRLEGSEK